MRVIFALVVFSLLTWNAVAQNGSVSRDDLQIIEKARELALDYLSNLPNFVCTETIRRFELPRRSQTWKLLDTIAVDVAFSDAGERYKLLTIDGKPTKKRFNEIGSLQSDSEFGSLLRWLFQPESQTKFQGERSEELRGRPTRVFSYHVDENYSKLEVHWGKRYFILVKPVHIVAAFGGLVYVDLETNRVLKITAIPSGIPADWSLAEVSQELDYGFTKIGGQEFFLPLHAEVSVTTRDGNKSRNEMEFGNYRRFSSESTLQFEPK